MTRTEPLEDLLRRTLVAHDQDLADTAPPGFEPPAPAPRPQRVRQVLAGILVAAAVTAVGVSASVLGAQPASPPGGTGTGTSAQVDTTPPPTSTGGTGFTPVLDSSGVLDYAGLRLQLPREWKLGGRGSCGEEDERDFVQILNYENAEVCPVREGAGVSADPVESRRSGVSVIDAAVAASWTDITAATLPAVVGDGVAIRKGTTKSGETLVFVPSHEVYFAFTAGQETVDQILASLAETRPRTGGVVPTIVERSSLAADDTSCTDQPTVNPAADLPAPPSSLASMAESSVAVLRVRATDDRQVTTVAFHGAGPPAPRLPYTTSILQVEEVLAGENLGPTIALTQAGGPGNCWITNTKLVQPGREYVIAIVPNRDPGTSSTGGFTPVNGTQGLFELSGDVVTRVDPAVTTVPETQSLAAFVSALRR